MWTSAKLHRLYDTRKRIWVSKKKKKMIGSMKFIRSRKHAVDKRTDGRSSRYSNSRITKVGGAHLASPRYTVGRERGGRYIPIIRGPSTRWLLVMLMMMMTMLLQVLVRREEGERRPILSCTRSRDFFSYKKRRKLVLRLGLWKYVWWKCTNDLFFGKFFKS